MRILIATSEAVPFAKTGGLADVCGALPIEIARQGHSCSLIMPAFRQALNCGQPWHETGFEFQVPIGTKQVTGRLLESRLPDSDVPVYLVHQPQYFDRPELYNERGRDYIDNCERFVFFCRAVIEAIGHLDSKPDVVHANDWQTALLPAYLKTEYRAVVGYEDIASLLTIHNLAYQGNYWHWDMLLTGLDWKYFNWRQLEFYGNLNLLKGGLVFADRLNTVSPRYAREIQTPEQGYGLEGVLQDRHEDLTGIINGVDYRLWDPATDEHLEEHFTAEVPQPGKSACKRALQEELKLPPREDVPLIGLVGRLVDQKGLDLVEHVMAHWNESSDVQWVILGTGDSKHHEALSQLASQWPRKVAVRLEFSNRLAHRIEAGADIFLMPSRYEPCGLNQLYSLKYGTIPVVRATGGLADTVVDLNDETLANALATGFTFQNYDAVALSVALRRACDAFADKPLWRRLVSLAMHQDWSWQRSAEEYISLYRRTVKEKRQRGARLHV